MLSKHFHRLAVVLAATSVAAFSSRGQSTLKTGDTVAVLTGTTSSNKLIRGTEAIKVAR